jgi:hypothetical protein
MSERVLWNENFKFDFSTLKFCQKKKSFEENSMALKCSLNSQAKDFIMESLKSLHLHF